MANFLYSKYKQALLGAGVNLAAGTIRAQLIDTADYAANAAADDFLADIPAGARIGNPVTLANKSVTNGVFDADDIAFNAVPAGSGGDAAAEALVIYRDGGTEAASELIAYIDTATGLPVTPNGGNINVAWHAGGIFSL